MADAPPDLDQLFEQLELLLKSHTMGVDLAKLGVNSSIALLAAQGLRAYLRGEKISAAEDFATVAEELQSRLSLAEARQREQS